MVYRYVPVLRWKRGEREAVQRLSVNGRADVLPLFVLAPQQYVGRAATARAPAVPAPNVVVVELQQMWGTAPFFIDAAELPLAAHGHPILDIATAARRVGLGLIPATRLNASLAYQNAVNTIASMDGRGVALRVDLHGMTSISSWIASWPHSPSQADLIVDVGANVANVSALGASTDHAFQSLGGATAWRSVTLVGTSIPDSFTGYSAGIHAIQRVEAVLWQRLSALPLSYRLDFGDYATVAMNTAPAGIRWGYPINVKYSQPNEIVVCRGVGTTGLGALDMDVQLIGHAGSIRSHPGRVRLPHCWGDQRVDHVASTSTGQRGLEEWVKIGVNRHIEITRHSLP